MLPPGWESALLDSWDFFFHLTIVLVPLFLFGSFLVGLVQEYMPPEKVERILRGYDEGVGNVAAAGLGAVTPFCSASTVPVLAGLLQAGSPLGLSFSFLLASPLVNELAVILLIGFFGFKVTAYYVALTFMAAIIGGVIIGRLGLDGDVKDISLSSTSGQTVATDGGTCGGCSAAKAPADKTHRERFETAGRDAVGFFVDTLPYIFLGITTGAIIHGIVPVEIVQAILGDQNPLAVPLATLAGAPIYVSMSAMLPIATSFSDQGVAIGTVMAFVIGGAGISIPNLLILNKLFKRRLLAVYAGTVATIGIFIGVVFNHLLA